MQDSLMLDLETLSTRKNARVMTIAAVLFNTHTGQIGDTMHLGLHRYGRINGQYDGVDDETLAWWLSPPQAVALKRITALIQKQPYAPHRALEKLAAFIAKHQPVTFWSNGASFDLAILDNLFTAHGMSIPWRFWQERDTRTIVDAARQITGSDPKKHVIFEGQPHDALNDARYQARYVIQAYKQLREHQPCAA
jgi:hypothetical protein